MSKIWKLKFKCKKRFLLNTWEESVIPQNIFFPQYKRRYNLYVEAKDWLPFFFNIRVVGNGATQSHRLNWRFCRKLRATVITFNSMATMVWKPRT